jgi:hypothetical protein
MREEMIVEAVLTEMRKIEESLLSRGLSWEEEYSAAYCPDLVDASKSVLDNLKERYNGKYNLVDSYGIQYRSKPDNKTPLVKVTLLDGDDYESKRGPREYEVEFRRIDWKNIKTSSSERYFTFYNDGYIDFEKDITLEDYLNKYHFYGQYNAFSKNFKLVINRNYVEHGLEKIETTEIEKVNEYLSITYNYSGIAIMLDSHEKRIVVGGKPIHMDEIEERVEKAKKVINEVKNDILIPGLVDKINYCLNVLEEDKDIEFGPRKK